MLNVHGVQETNTNTHTKNQKKHTAGCLFHYCRDTNEFPLLLLQSTGCPPKNLAFDRTKKKNI